MQSFYNTFDFLELIKKWPQIVGPKMAPVTSPLRIRKDCLFIVTMHAIYSQELSFLTEPIKTEIFKVFPNLKPIIKKIVFQTQEGFFKEKAKDEQELSLKSKLHPQSPRYKALKLEAERLFNDVEDPLHKEMLISLYIQTR